MKQTSKLKVGHGMAEGTTMGPVTTSRSLDKAEDMAKDALAKGAKTVLGNGKRMDTAKSNGGYFMEPTVMTGVTDDMLMSQDEIFAPLLGVSVFDNEDEIVARANNTSMGLASYVFTKDVDRLWRMFEKLEAGMIGLVRFRPPKCFLFSPGSRLGLGFPFSFGFSPTCWAVFQCRCYSVAKVI